MILAMACLAGCSGFMERNPVSAGGPSPGNPLSLQTREGVGNRHLWGFWTVQIDPLSRFASVSPDRSAQMHLNATKMLETGLCSDCLKISNVKLTAPNELSIDVTVKHPFASNLNLTAFDVRGIFIANNDHVIDYYYSVTLGDSQPRMLNPDGYTPLYNPTDFPSTLPSPPALKYYQGKFSNSSDLTATVNPFIAFSKTVPRRMFLPGTQETQTIKLHIPGGPFKFGYAIDSSWTDPGKKVTDPEKDFPINRKLPGSVQNLSFCRRHTR